MAARIFRNAAHSSVHGGSDFLKREPFVQRVRHGIPMGVGHSSVRDACVCRATANSSVRDANARRQAADLSHRDETVCCERSLTCSQSDLGGTDLGGIGADFRLLGACLAFEEKPTGKKKAKQG